MVSDLMMKYMQMPKFFTPYVETRQILEMQQLVCMAPSIIENSE